MADRKKCPHCGMFVFRDEVDVGVGVIHGPYGCGQCGWSEYEEYDCRHGQKTTKEGHVLDQWGGLTPRRSKP